MWDISTGTLLHKFTELEDCSTRFTLSPRDVSCVTKVVFSPDGRQIAALGAADSIIFVWDICGNPLKKFHGDEFDFNNIIFSPDSQQIGRVRRNNITWKTTLKEGNPLFNNNNFNFAVSSAVFALNSRRIAIGAEDGSVHLLDTLQQPLEEPKSLDSTKCGNGKFSMVRFSPDGRQIATVTEDGSVCLWDTSGRLLDKFERFNGDVKSVGFDHNNKLLVALGKSFLAVDRLVNSSGTVAVNFKNSDSRTDIPPDKCNIYSFAFSRDGQRIVTGGFHSDICVWDTSGNLLSKFAGALSAISAVAISPDGKQLVSAAIEGNARSWDGSGNFLGELTGPVPFSSNKVAFSSDGQQIVTGSGSKYGENVRLWDSASKKLLATFNVKESVYDVTFSQDGLKIATLADNKNILIWRVAGDVNQLLLMNCNWVQDYLRGNSRVSESDRNLCKDVPALPISLNSPIPSPVESQPESKTKTTETPVNSCRQPELPTEPSPKPESPQAKSPEPPPVIVPIAPSKPPIRRPIRSKTVKVRPSQPKAVKVRPARPKAVKVQPTRRKAVKVRPARKSPPRAPRPSNGIPRDTGPACSGGQC